MTIHTLLAELVREEGSDLFLSVGAPPMLKVDGVLTPVSAEPLSTADVNAMISEVASGAQIQQYHRARELNIPLMLEELGRFRVNLFFQQGEPALVARYIKSIVPSIKQLGLPDLLETLVMEDRGLVLLVGGTGTGKSTTLAAMINYRARLKTGHILTVEDPIEYVFGHHASLVNQREIGVDTDSYDVALKNAMREAPDVIMIGEVRDTETMKQAISYAETGHLCLTTLHASNAVHALDRIKNFFPDSAQKQLRSDLSSHLRAIVSQRLAVGRDGKRVVAVEVMLNTPLIQELILQDRNDEIHDAMVQARTLGCQTFEDHLYELVQMGKLSQEEALHYADSRTNLSLRFRLEGTASEIRADVPRDVCYARNTRFSDFDTFRIRPCRAEDEMQNLNRIVEKGIAMAMKLKGLRQDDVKPDIEIRYTICRGRRDAVAGDMESAVKAHTSSLSEKDVTGGLAVDIVDTVRDKSVWHLMASRKLFAEMDSNEAISSAFLDIFSEFPPIQF